MTDATKLSTFLESNHLNARRLLAVSHKLETLRPEDRAIKLSKRQGKKKESGEAGAAPAGKPRSGRPVTPRALQAALTGGSLSGPSKQRILRAVNALLQQKKKDAVELKALF